MSENLSKEEMDELMAKGDTENNYNKINDIDDNRYGNINSFSEEDKDILGEIGNINMGTAATTLYALLKQKVSITTPRVDIVKWNNLSREYDRPCVGVKIAYKEGVKGATVLLMKDSDVKVVSKSMFGGSDEEKEEKTISDMDLSAISEAMNQMVGSSSTSMSALMGIKIDINTPEVFIIDFNDDEIFKNIGEEWNNDDIVRISFNFKIGDSVDSTIMQILPVKFARQMIKKLQRDERISDKNYTKKNDYQDKNVSISPAQFKNFEFDNIKKNREDISLIMDIPLEITVELGRTKRKIKDILEFSAGTIVELDKVAGEPIDILANGKFVARGEVVVIDENFGIRITDIVSVENRI